MMKIATFILCLYYSIIENEHITIFIHVDTMLKNNVKMRNHDFMAKTKQISDSMTLLLLLTNIS